MHPRGNIRGQALVQTPSSSDLDNAIRMILRGDKMISRFCHTLVWACVSGSTFAYSYKVEMPNADGVYRVGDVARIVLTAFDKEGKVATNGFACYTIDNFGLCVRCSSNFEY